MGYQNGNIIVCHLQSAHFGILAFCDTLSTIDILYQLRGDIRDMKDVSPSLLPSWMILISLQMFVPSVSTSSKKILSTPRLEVTEVDSLPFSVSWSHDPLFWMYIEITLAKSESWCKLLLGGWFIHCFFFHYNFKLSIRPRRISRMLKISYLIGSMMKSRYINSTVCALRYSFAL